MQVVVFLYKSQQSLFTNLSKVWVERRTSRVPNQRLMSKIYCYRLLALGFTHVKFDVWPGTNKITKLLETKSNQFLINVLAFTRIGDFVWYMREFALNVIIISSFCCLRLCCWRWKLVNDSASSRETGTHPSWNHETITSRSNCKPCLYFPTFSVIFYKSNRIIMCGDKSYIHA